MEEQMRRISEMDGRNDNRKRLASLLDEVAIREGMHQTNVEGVRLFRRSEPLHRGPMVYHPNIVIVGQGRKRAYIGDDVYEYDAFNYLVSSVPMPAECEADASPENPILIVAIDVEPVMLGELVLEMDDLSTPVGPTPRGFSTTPMDDGLIEAVTRLLEFLKCPTDSRILGRQTVREIAYRVLRGEQGGSLRALANRDDHFARIARVVKYIHVEYAKPLSVEELSRRAGMSVPVFHNHFKLVTACSPLQYLKRIRLDYAKRFMAHDGYNASTAARAVGYESPSQFSREFKRLFGMSPVEEAEHTRARLVGG
jgi:AraC-like DNA-binding protein